MSILDERELTAEERAVVADEPRPGVWFHTPDDLDELRLTGMGDARMLTQEQTDRLIVFELQRRVRPDDVSTLGALVGVVGGMVDLPDGHCAGAQRGGIHSEPVVKLLACRTWGDRDRSWFELRKGARVYADENRRAFSYQAPGTVPVGIAISDPHSDGTIAVRTDTNDPNEISRAISILRWRPE